MKVANVCRPPSTMTLFESILGGVWFDDHMIMCLGVNGNPRAFDTRRNGGNQRSRMIMSGILFLSVRFLEHAGTPPLQSPKLVIGLTRGFESATGSEAEGTNTLSLWVPRNATILELFTTECDAHGIVRIPKAIFRRHT